MRPRKEAHIGQPKQPAKQRAWDVEVGLAQNKAAEKQWQDWKVVQGSWDTASRVMVADEEEQGPAKKVKEEQEWTAPAPQHPKK